MQHILLPQILHETCSVQQLAEVNNIAGKLCQHLRGDDLVMYSRNAHNSHEYDNI